MIRPRDGKTSPCPLQRGNFQFVVFFKKETIYFLNDISGRENKKLVQISVQSLKSVFQ